MEEYIQNLRPPNIDYSIKTTLIVFNRPYSIDSIGINDYSYFKERCEKLEKSTFLDFIDKQRGNVQIEKIIVPNVEIILIDRDNNLNRREIISKYPYWIHSYIEISNIGINEEKNQALVYYSFNSGPGVSGGFFLLFEKKRKKWKQKGFIPSWAS